MSSEDAPALDDARAALAAQKAAEEEARAQQAKRDQAIVRLHVENGWNPPRIARETGMSVSTIRLTLKVAGISVR